MNRRQTIKNLFLSGLGLFGTNKALANNNDDSFEDAYKILSNELQTNTNLWILCHSHILLSISNNSKLEMSRCQQIADSVMFDIFAAPRELHIKKQIITDIKDGVPLSKLNDEIDSKNSSLEYSDLL